MRTVLPRRGVDHFKSDDALWTVLLRHINRSHTPSAQKPCWTEGTVSARSRDSRNTSQHFFSSGGDEPANGLCGGSVEAQQRFHFVADSSRGVVLCIKQFPLGDRTIGQLVKESDRLLIHNTSASRPRTTVVGYCC